MMTRQCNDHKTYHSRAAAERALADLIAHAKRTGQGGKSYKRLNVFPCGNHFHVGRANQQPKNYKPTQPQPTLITFGEARRKFAALERQLNRTIDYCYRKRAEAYAKLIEADRLAGWLD
jgi:hypothetical protein